MAALMETINDTPVRESAFDRSVIRNPRMAAFYDHWLDLRKGRLMAARADIDPTDFPYALGNAFMVDVDQRGALPRFRFRLAGTLIVEVHKRELGGLWLEDVFKDFHPGSAINGDYFRVVATRRPAYYLGKPSLSFKYQDTIERLLLPLGKTDARVDMILAMMVYYGSEGTENYQ